jgi:hypothetical protein
MSALTMKADEAGVRLPRAAPSVPSLDFHAPMLARSCAAVIVLTAILTPACCLNGSHAHGIGLDGIGPICFNRAARQ